MQLQGLDHMKTVLFFYLTPSQVYVHKMERIKKLKEKVESAAV